MDISVSRLNERMALQLPAEFPLGLVFVVGRVEEPAVNGSGPDDLRKGPRRFFLVEGNHRLRCVASERARRSLRFGAGDRIRAGGHLAFDALYADYYLLARDVDLADDLPSGPSTLKAIIADVEQRARTADLPRAELPEWVRRLAPPELQETSPDELRSARVDRADETLVAATVALPDEVVQFLSEAMDADREVELTPQLLASISTAQEGDGQLSGEEPEEVGPTPPGAHDLPPGDVTAREAAPAAAASAAGALEAANSPRPGTSRRQRLLWALLIGAVVLLFLLMVAAFVAALLANLAA
ncbi:MAG: exodeoxyribonuclease VII large subunit [Candidatus Promineifilaceae bacterium]|nr:exodeoxyribonuclease VII large subunit [Candidatus Promineifilaceae bacterium]